jgi:hypothetical protein
VSLQTEELQIQISGNENIQMLPSVTTGPIGPTGLIGQTGPTGPTGHRGTLNTSCYFPARDPGAPGQIPGNNIIDCCGSKGPLNFLLSVLDICPKDSYIINPTRES